MVFSLSPHSNEGIVHLGLKLKFQDGKKNLSIFALDPEEKNLKEIPEKIFLSSPGMKTEVIAKLNKERKELVNILGHLQLYSGHFLNA